MAATFVQNRAKDASSVASIARAFASNVQSGNLLLVACWQGNDSTDDTSGWTVSDTLGNTYTRFAHSSETTFSAGTSTGSKIALFATISGSGGANTITVNFGASKQYARMVIWEYSSTATPVASAVTDSVADTAAHEAPEFPYYYRTSTTASDPGAANLRLNNATLASVTAMYVDDLDAYSADNSNFFNALQAGKSIRLRMDSDASRYVDYTVTTVTDNTGWFTIGLSYVGVSGTPPSQTDNTAWWANFAGTDDINAPAVTAVANGRVGAAMQQLTGSGNSTVGDWAYFYRTSTTASDPGSGNVRLNNADLTAVTAMYIDSVDSGSTNRDTTLGTVVVGDWLRIYDNNDNGRWVDYQIASMTNNTGWWTIGLTYKYKTAEALPQADNTAVWVAIYHNSHLAYSSGYSPGPGFGNYVETYGDGYLGAEDKATASSGSVTPKFTNANLTYGLHFGISWAIAPAAGAEKQSSYYRRIRGGR